MNKKLFAGLLCSLFIMTSGINSQASTTHQSKAAASFNTKMTNGIKHNIKGAELQVYNKLLNDLSWQRKNGIQFNGNESTLDDHYFVDLDQDGVSEMLLHHGDCEADMTVSVVQYKNGKIKVQHLPISHGGYSGFSKSTKVFFISGGWQGYTDMLGYKLVNGNCKKVYECTTEADDSDASKINYTVNGKKASSAEYEKSLTAFGTCQ